MKIQFTARHFKATEEMKSMVQTELDRLERFFERITSCHCVLDAEKPSRLTAEITIGTRGKTLVAKAAADQMGKAIDQALSKIERQLKKANARKHDRRHTAPLASISSVHEE